MTPILCCGSWWSSTYCRRCGADLTRIGENREKADWHINKCGPAIKSKPLPIIKGISAAKAKNCLYCGSPLTPGARIAVSLMCDKCQGGLE